MIRDRIGDFRDDAENEQGRRPEFDTPAHCRWWLAGERGVVQAQIQLNPERPPRVQSLTLAVPPAAGSKTLEMMESVCGMTAAPPRPIAARAKISCSGVRE